MIKKTTDSHSMCVPPVMMANVAERIWEHWLSKLN